MRSKLGTGVISILLLGLLALATPVLAQSPSQAAEILLDPTPVEVIPGEAFTVTLKINNVPEPGMAAYDFKITFTPGVIEFGEDIADHEWPDPDYGTPFIFNVDNSAGYVAFNDIYTGTPATSGDVTLVVLHGTATATQSATTALHFEKVDIFDPDANAIPAAVTHGEVVVWVPVQIGISVSPTFIDFGDIIAGHSSVAQTVTVTNTGNVAEDFSATLDNMSAPDVYTAGLAITWLPAPPEGVAVLDNVDVSLVLTLPPATPSGTHTATLVFWAEAAGP